MDAKKFAKGPWSELFSGTFQEQEVQCLENKDSFLLTLVLDKSGNKTLGAVVELYLLYAARGEVEAFCETLPRHLTALLHHSPNQTLKYFVLGIGPGYAQWNEKAVNAELERQYNSAIETAQLLQSLAKTYDITLTEWKKASENEKGALLAQPLLAPLLASAQYAHAAGEPHSEKGFEAVPTSAHTAMLLGKDREGKPVEEPLAILFKNCVSGGTEKQRLQLVQVLLEGTLLANVPVLCIDSNERFSAMATPTLDREKLRLYGVNFEPIGFPLQTFHPLQEIKVETGLLSADQLSELFGWGGGEKVNAIQAALERKPKSIAETVSFLQQKSVQGDFTAFVQGQSVRILQLLDKRYPGFFAGSNDFGELVKPWTRAIGRVGVASVKGLDARQTLLLSHSLVKGMFERVKSQGETSKPRAMLVLPEFSQWLPKGRTLLHEEIFQSLKQGAQYGLGYIASAEHESDFPKELEDSDAFFGIIEGEDVGLRLKDNKQYRFLVRPPLAKKVE